MMQKVNVSAVSPAASLKAQLVLALAAILAVYYQHYIPFFFLLLLFLYLSWSYIWTLIGCRSTEVTNELPYKSIFQGDSFTWKTTFVNHLPFPIARCGIRFFWPSELSLEGNINKKDYDYTAEGTQGNADYFKTSWQLVDASYAWMPENAKRMVKMEITALKRGIYYLPPAKFYTGDPSGLFQGGFNLGQERKLAVYPSLEKTEVAQEAVFMEENNELKGPGLEDRYEYQGVRDYQLNDPLKSINWYASARSGTLKSNRYQPKISERCLIVFDACAVGHPYYEGQISRLDDPMLEKALSYLAGLVNHQIERGVLTAFLTNAPLKVWEKKRKAHRNEPGVLLKRKRNITILPYQSGTGQVQKILEVCAAIDETSRARLHEQKKLWENVKAISSRAIVYIIGYYAPPTWWENLSDEEKEKDTEYPPENFYTPGRLKELEASKIKFIKLSGGNS